ncbi:MAG: hypothetical protein IKW39_03710 [Alphaproteobacteria bacterium]|nr:hypothetical protein [Alphaproteobacteria bacterium]
MISLKKNSAIYFLILSLSACSSANYSTTSAPLSASLHSHHSAELKFNNRVSATSQETVILGLFSIGSDNIYADGVNYSASNSMNLSVLDTTARVKAAAAYNALTKAKADVLYAPVYYIQEDNYLLWKNVKASVRAYPANIVGFKEENNTH